MKSIVLTILTILILSGCTPKAAFGPVFLYPKVELVELELKSFSFYPNHIAILKNSSSPFTFRLKNTARIKHNFTLIDSQKNVLISMDVMPDRPTTVTIESLDSGNYIFYCNRFLHRCQGMQGMLMVGQYQQ